jgi:hypothetical protein
LPEAGAWMAGCRRGVKGKDHKVVEASVKAAV